MTYLLGIDLGTTNTVVSYTDTNNKDPQIEVLKIPQYVDSNTIESKGQLSSFLYLGLENENFKLPWEDDSTAKHWAIGSYAQSRSSKAPDRTVAVGKSWLSHTAVDRRANLLPTNAPEGVSKISPIEMAQRMLAHIRSAWEHQFPASPMRDQQVVITVPASFDISAKDLTREAAVQAGFSETFILLEEPQAALYAWLFTHKENWRKEVQANENILVIDVGGGTADFSLIEAIDDEGKLSLNRKAVGKHLLVGGDNMDLALAHFTAQKFKEKNHKIDAWQNTALWHACRQAKEKLLGDSDKTSFKISVAGRGKKLIGGSISTELIKDEIQTFLASGFFPLCPLDCDVAQGRSGFQETGLPYETEAAVTKHLAHFLRQHLSSEDAIHHILFNGGVFKASIFKEAILTSLKNWFSTSPKVISQETASNINHLDIAVSFGATYYAFIRQTGGLRIKGGTARSYYLGFEAGGMAIPGMPKPMNALCVVPKGLEEGEEHEIPAQQISLSVGKSFDFPFFSSTHREEDTMGTIINDIQDDDLDVSSNITASIQSEYFEAGDNIPITIISKLQETGTLEIWAIHKETDEKWKFEFNAREESSTESTQ